jgi:tetratricopeptide (TPR) repeat protein
MFKRQTSLKKARQLAEGGRHAELVDYLGEWPREQIEKSATLSLMYGTAHARLGRHDEGSHWVNLALDRSCEEGDRTTQTRALNARGAIAFVAGRIDEAADYFTQALLSASREGDHATIGRCSNNLGIIANLRGRHAEAIGSYSMAVAAFEKAELRQGIAEARHNLGITHREQEQFDQALTEARAAHQEATTAGDRTLTAMTVRGRAEIRVYLGELELAQREIDEAIATHRSLGDRVEEAQDLRIVAAIQAASYESDAAEQTLRDVIARAEALGRPQLVAEARRDLAHLLRNAGRHEEALEAARSSIRLFEQLGAEAEIRKLDTSEWGYPLSKELQRALEPLHEAQKLADTGQYANLVAHLRERSYEELERSPTLALLNGIGHARLGQLDEAWQWIMIALNRARIQGDRAVEVRALNVYGAIALERGGIDEATYFFTRVQAEAMRDGDLATVGRCANNLGIIANMRGDYGRAVGAYTMAMAAYQRAGLERGLAETHHNLGITYRDQGDLVQAMQAADRAVEDAERLGDTALQAQALAGRAEIRVARREPQIAIREAERAVALHREREDDVRETEDLRILACALADADRVDEAEKQLRAVIERATAHSRPLLVATTQRDLAYLLARMGRHDEARDLACEARETFDRLAATIQVERLDEFLADIPPLEAEAGAA